ncbi:HNH endonuclease [Paraliomyxa miuraensis]|uniref:HNH endonuclease n=1 Tax=Paraliomyxa miuraensis TaxID=376150 RepID=UPI003899B3AB
MFFLDPVPSEGAIQDITQATQELERAIAEAQKEITRVGPEAIFAKIRRGRPQQRKATVTVFDRDSNVVAFVLHRAGGQCEGCGQEAPFLNGNGQPYLEVHHVQRLADGGADEPENAIGLCPTCHRRAHYSCDREEFTLLLQARLLAIHDG